MDSTQDKQTDAAGRAEELRQQVANLLAAHKIPTDLNASPAGNFQTKWKNNWEDCTEAVLQLITSATRTAVTEALDKVEAEVIGQNETISTEMVGNSRPNHNYRNNRNNMRDEQRQRLAAVRAVIAAGGKTS